MNIILGSLTLNELQAYRQGLICGNRTPSISDRETWDLWWRYFLAGQRDAGIWDRIDAVDRLIAKMIEPIPYWI